MRKVVVLVGAIALIWSAWSAPGALASGASPQFSFSTDESGATFTCALDGGAGVCVHEPEDLQQPCVGAAQRTMTKSLHGADHIFDAGGPEQRRGDRGQQRRGSGRGGSYTASASGTASFISFYVGSGIRLRD